MILVSAFSPFDIDPENSTQLILEEAKRSFSTKISSVVLPVSFERAWTELHQVIEKVKPEIVIALGQADSRSAITIEEIALNRLEARIADNDGFQPTGQEVVPGGPLALATDWALDEFIGTLKRAGLKTEKSHHAGTFVCNALMYRLLLHAKNTGYSAGFVHFPLLVGQKLGTGREALRPPSWLTIQDGAKALNLLINLMN